MKQFITPALVASGLLSHSFAEGNATNPIETVTFADVVVTATGSEKEAFDTALPINLLEARDLDEKVITSIAEVFQREPGVDAVTTGTGSVHPMIRGLYGERVLVLVNGVRLSEQRPGGNHVFSLDPAQIERVEVVRGPASVLYGSDAIAGVVNFITKGAAEETSDAMRFSGETEVQYESATEGLKESAHLQFGQGRFNGYVGGTYRDSKNIETADGELLNSAYEGGTFWAGGNYIGDDWKAYLDYSFMEADIGIPGATAFAEDYFKGEKHQKLTFGFEGDDLSEIIERAAVDFGWQRHNRHRYRLATTGNEVNIWLDIDTFTAKPQVILVPNDTHRITLGLDTFFEEASSARTISFGGVYDGVPVIPDSTRVGVGAFAQDEITLGDRWILTPGLRADWIKAQTDGVAGHLLTSEETSECGALTGNLGLLYKASNEVNFYGNLGRAFRAPTLLELYFAGPHDASGDDYGDPDLDPETSWNVDLGIKTQSERLQTMVGVFYNMIDNYIVLEKQTSGDRVYKNYADVSLFGAETGIDYDLGGGFSTFASLSYVHGENDNTGDALPGIPPLKARYGLRYDQILGAHNALWIELSGVTASDQDRTAANERETDGYTRGDVSMGVDLGETWSFVAAVENVADVNYEDHLSTVWQEYGLTDQAGRNLKLMVKARF